MYFSTERLLDTWGSVNGRKRFVPLTRPHHRSGETRPSLPSRETGISIANLPYRNNGDFRTKARPIPTPTPEP